MFLFCKRTILQFNISFENIFVYGKCLFKISYLINHNVFMSWYVHISDYTKKRNVTNSKQYNKEIVVILCFSIRFQLQFRLNSR